MSRLVTVLGEGVRARDHVVVTRALTIAGSPDRLSTSVRSPGRIVDAAGGTAFWLLIALNITLFIRPAEILEPLEALPLYECLIAVCLLASLPAVLRQFQPAALVARPVSVCVFGLVAAVFLSHLSHFNIYAARTTGVAFVKLVVYYLLVVAIIDTPTRLRQFVTWLAVLVMCLTVLALLQYHGYINIPSLEAYMQADLDPETGEKFVFARLCSTGIFNDPNDLCLILLFGAMVCLYKVSDGTGPRRFLWLVPVVVFGYALNATHSRGGFLAMLAGTSVLLFARVGWRRAVPVAVVVLPILFGVYAGRQTSLSTADGTGQERIRLWSDGLMLFRGAPIFGIGKDQFAEELGLVAHNSFIHCFVELGYFGGSLFLGAFFFSMYALYRLGQEPEHVPDVRLRQLRPFLMGVVAAYAAGMMSISRAYVVPTYLVLALVTVYLRVVSPQPPAAWLRMSSRLATQFATLAIAFLAAAFLFVRFFARFG